jgi:hypothetical protein
LLSSNTYQILENDDKTFLRNFRIKLPSELYLVIIIIIIIVTTTTTTTIIIIII